MTDYHMLYENVLLSAWGATWKDTDPFKLANAGIFASLDNELSGQYGHDVKFGLSAALRKVAADNKNNAVNPMLMDLDATLWTAKSYNDVCQILDKAKTLFESLGMTV